MTNSLLPFRYEMQRLPKNPEIGDHWEFYDSSEDREQIISLCQDARHDDQYNYRVVAQYELEVYPNQHKMFNDCTLIIPSV